MKLQKIQKLTVVFTLLFLTIHSLKISHLQTNSEASGQVKNQFEQSTSSFNGFLVYPSYGQSSKLTDYDVTSLNETQKEVDAFIRNKTAVGDSNLTKAQGDGQTFVYRYENKTENSSKVWVITICACSETEGETNNIDSEPKTSDSSSTSNEGNQNSGTQPAQTQKYAITGINYVQNSKLTDEQKTQMEEKFKKGIQNFQKLQKQFERSFYNTFKALEFL